MYFLLFLSIILLILFFIIKNNLLEHFSLYTTFTRTNNCYSYDGHPCKVESVIN